MNDRFAMVWRILIADFDMGFETLSLLRIEVMRTDRTAARSRGQVNWQTSTPEPHSRLSTEVTFGRGDLSVCPLEGFPGAHESLISNWRGVPQGSPQGQTLRALLLRGTSALHWCVKCLGCSCLWTVVRSLLDNNVFPISRGSPCDSTKCSVCGRFCVSLYSMLLCCVIAC